MRLVAYIQTLSPTMLRRIVAAFSTLAARGISTHFTHTSDPYALETANYNLIFLPDWFWDGGRLPKAQGEYVYDLSNADALNHESVINVIQQCQHVTVPTSTIGKLVKPFCSHVIELPSLIASEWFQAQPQKRPDRPIVACIGDYNWSLYLEPLKEMLKEYPDVRVVTSSFSLYNALPEKRSAFVEADVAVYPKIVRSSYLALFPGERRTTDPGPIHEFGLFGVPSIVGSAFGQDIKPRVSGLAADTPDSFITAFRKLTDDDRYRSTMGNAASRVAREHTAVRGADAWLHTVSKFCPITAPNATLK